MDKRLLLPITAAACAAAMPLSAQADIIASIQDFSLSFSDDDISGFSADGDGTTLNIDRFDTALGTLNGATLKLQSNANLGATVEGSDGAPDGFTVVQLGVSTDFFLFASAPAFSVPPEYSDLSGLFTSCDASFLAPCAAGDDTDFALNAMLPFDPTDLDLLQAPGTVDVQLSFSSSFLFEVISDFSTGQGTGGISGSWDGTVSIEYDFTPVTTIAAPGSAGLLMIAASALFYRKRRRYNSV